MLHGVLPVALDARHALAANAQVRPPEQPPEHERQEQEDPQLDEDRLVEIDELRLMRRSAPRKAGKSGRNSCGESRGSFTESGGVRQWKRQRKLVCWPGCCWERTNQSPADPTPPSPAGKADGCEAVQIFARPSAQWRAKPFLPEEVSLFRSEHATVGWPTLSHASYLINLAAGDPAILDKSRDALADEMFRAEELGLDFVVLHPGAHVGAGVEDGVEAAADSLSDLDARTRGMRVRLLLEITAGQGSCLGCRFEEMEAMLSRARGGDRIGICFDTCHAHASGYDLSTEEGYERTFDAFTRVIGIDKLRAFHLNDSKTPTGSHVDRHAEIGDGYLGPTALLAAGERRALRDDARRAGDAVGARRTVVVRAQPRAAAGPHRRAAPGRSRPSRKRCRKRPIHARGGSSAEAPSDLTQSAYAWRRWSTKAREAGRLDVLVNNAAIFQIAPLEESTAEHVRSQFEANVYGTVFATQAALPALKASRGTVVNISSAAGHKTAPGAAIYGATKAAVESLTRSWALELAPHGVRVNASRRPRRSPAGSSPSPTRPSPGSPARCSRSTVA